MQRIHIQQYQSLIRKFPKSFTEKGPEKFTDPFRYHPHPYVAKAAAILLHQIDSDKELSDALSEGKMLGVLVVRDSDSEFGFLAGFSGNVGGKSHIEGFVPPIFDLTVPEGHFKRKEEEITLLSKQICRMENSPELLTLLQESDLLRKTAEEELGRMKAEMAARKRRREAIRRESDDIENTSELIRESQKDKADYRRLRLSWEERKEKNAARIKEIKNRIDKMKILRASMSDELQKWIFSRYIVHNACGGETSIGDLFSAQGLVPPGGTGECAAPKLLEYAYRHGLSPVAMGEFWYGRSPGTAVRTHGHFYPSCTSKCGPLLGFMLKGIETSPDIMQIPEPVSVYEDNEIIVVCKPSGMPSVPGLDGRVSLLEWLRTKYRTDIISVHRLDMDTSGIMVFAKTETAAAHLHRQFEEHTVRKTYIARLSAPLPGECPTQAYHEGETGTIRLALSPDYDERPRQKADIINGKDAVTGYEVTSVNPDRSIDITLHPLTGRTHQLRVHMAHTLGLGMPIMGDKLYGGATAARLHLHALCITIAHPSTKKLLTFSCKELCW